MSKKDIKGITARKDDFSDWYTQVIQKAELIEYSDVSGCYILRPNSYAIWEKIQQFFDAEIKKMGVKNAYFPLFIPESYLTKEAQHIEGFAAEVAWVTEHGNTKMPERLAIRPTSETAMYDAYSKWVRSHKDLPLKLNQWCNVVRWEFKNPIPFLRSREFLWQEGHTVFATKKEAEEEAQQILALYERVFNELYAIPVLKGKKSDQEKFAGADYTLSLELFLPMGKAIQGCTSHHLGQNFSKAFQIKFLDDQGKEEYAWQNSWGITTRTIGIMVLMHGDDKGLVVPPRVAPTQIVIVPILFDPHKAKIASLCKKLKEKLAKKYSVYLDDREGYTPGWKFNEWEVKGVPLRIEVGPKDLENNQATLVRRDTGEKQAVPIPGIEKEAGFVLEQIQQNLFKKAEEHLQDSIVKVNSMEEAKKEIENKKLVFAPWCGKEGCEDNLKYQLNGAKSLNSPFEQPPLVAGQKCFACDNKAESWFYFGKSY
ncbi:MAG: proline--tRNA ligase [Candidatus Woesearchaeota archaeon]